MENDEFWKFLNFGEKIQDGRHGGHLDKITGHIFGTIRRIVTKIGTDV